MGLLDNRPGLLNPDMASLYEQAQRRQKIQNALMMMAMGASGAPPHPGMMQPGPDISEFLKLQQFQQAQQQQRAQQTASSKLFGGQDPQTGITWNQGRPGLLGTPEGTSLLGQIDPEGVTKAAIGQQFAKPKDPMVRDFKEGDQFVTKTYNRQTGEWEEMSRAPRYKPGVNVDVGGMVGEIGDVLTKAGASKRAVDLEDRRVATTQMASQGATLIRNLHEGGDRAVSWTGGISRGLNKLSSQGTALAREVGFDLDVDKFEFAGDLAGESSVIKSQILGLAVALTKADQGSRPSDFDVQTSLNRLAASSGSAKTMARTIKSMLDEKMNDFAIDYRVRSGEDFDWDEELRKHNIEFPDISDPNDPLGIR